MAETHAAKRLREPAAARWAMRLLAVGYVFLLVAWPTSLIARNTFSEGWGGLVEALTDEAVIDGLQLTAVVAGVATAINFFFGLGMALLLTRYEFPLKRLLSALIDVPLSVSPVVVGLALLLVYSGRYGWFGPTLEENGLKIIFSTPGMIMATAFVALPLMIREVTPVLNEIGDDQEQAARSLGANAWQTFRRITLPAIKWAAAYGLVLTLARALGEYGAIKIVSGNVIGQTQTATLVVENKYQNFEQHTAYTTAFVLALAAVVCIVVVSILRKDEHS